MGKNIKTPRANAPQARTHAGEGEMTCREKMWDQKGGAGPGLRAEEGMNNNNNLRTALYRWRTAPQRASAKRLQGPNVVAVGRKRTEALEKLSS